MNVIEYFKDIAINLKEIAHTDDVPKFDRVSSLANLEEFLANMTSGEYPRLIFVNNREGRFGDANSDNVLDEQYYSFYIVTNNTVFDDFAEREENINVCEAIVKKIISRMKNDKLTDSQTSPSYWIGMRNLDINSINYMTIGPIGDNCIGIQVNFLLIQNPNIKYNSDDWIDG